MPLTFGSHVLNRILGDLHLTCLDVGARRGFTDDLLPIAGAVEAVGFEPDPEECADLNTRATSQLHPWRSLRYVPVALGPSGSRTLNLYRQRGCSSLLEADQDLARRFARSDYFEPEGSVQLVTVPLDEAAQRYGLTDAVYMKIDVQGYEDQVFASGPQLLAGSLLAIRTELSFIPLYKNQPLFGDIADQLRKYGFSPMGFEELHHWRRRTKVKHPRIAPGPIPYSRGQIVHGDVLFLRDPETLPDDSIASIERLLIAAFLAMTYQYLDHTADIFMRPQVSRYLAEHYQCNVESVLIEASASLRRRHRANARRIRIQNFKHWARRKLGT